MEQTEKRTIKKQVMKKITVSLMRGLEKQVLNGEISYSRMIKILNERLLPESKNVPSEERQKVIKEIMEKHRQDNLYSSKPPFILFDELAAKIDLAFIH